MVKKILIIFFIALSLSAQQNLIHHEITATAEPENSFISVVDEITIPANMLEDSVVFKLHSGLKITNNPLIINTGKSVDAEDIGMDKDNNGGENKLILNLYKLNIPKNHKGDFKFTIKYGGKIDSPVKQSTENYARGFSESPGIIWKEGIYLAGSTFWVPYFNDSLITFNLTTTVPENWKTVSVGKRTTDKTEMGKHIERWESSTPQEEVFLIAAAFNEYSYSMGNIKAMAFLRTPDEALANKYLETTAQYMEMYRNLIGPYPYTKFALVENFWETGYGMPSFTLLGEKIIRFPFILHSSYPHELLHNWWGNSVYVDFNKGNWCEGITVYMADHLIKEQRKQAVEYRRATLQKFTNYVTPANDFPLSKFLSRYDAPSEAIGYGKSMMMFHMLRRKVGDELFIKGFQKFYRDNKFKRASFDDIRIAFEEVTGEKLKWFFDQWVKRTGAPQIALEKIKIRNIRDFTNVSFTIKQIQSDSLFYIDLPVTFVTEKGTVTKIFEMNSKEERFNFSTPYEPSEILIDPQFDVLRKLDPKETPPTITELFGAKKTLILLPEKEENKYNEFVSDWIKGKEEKYIIKKDNEIEKLPQDKSVLILGIENKFTKTINSELKKYNSVIQYNKVVLGKRETVIDSTEVFIITEHPLNTNKVIAFLSVGNNNAIHGLIRKLTHYGKYSYLVFTGNEPVNIIKGQWDVVNSPLVKVLNGNSKTKAVFEKRVPLATLAPAFSSERMMETIKFLASDKLKGRGIDMPEINDAAEYIKNKFEECGLLPGADNGTYYQTWVQNVLNKKNLKLRNVIGIIPGNNDNLKNAPIVISAHYDHLGFGWPDVRKGNEGKIHNGADDNASGVAVLLELAKTIGKTLKPARTIIFIAFTGEEAGLVGSRYFVNNYKKYSVQKILANLNLDSVGRMLNKKLMIINGNTAREWKFIFMGTEFTTGIPTELISQNLDVSDQIAFIEKGIPAVQFFVGPNQDYHKPTDDVEKIDPDGLVKTATVAKEVLAYLAERSEPLLFTGKKKNIIPSADIPMQPKQIRKVSTGIMPDFTYSGKGVKVGGVSEDSPAAVAGILKEDIIKIFDGKKVKDLRGYTKLLKEKNPGETVIIIVERNGKKKKFNVKLSER